MFIEKNKKGLLIKIDDAIESVEQQYFCPCCNGEVYIAVESLRASENPMGVQFLTIKSR